MKSYTFLLLVLLISAVFTRRLRRSHRNRKSHTHRNLAPADNPAYQFLLGFVSELSGQPALIEECSAKVKGWEAAGAKEVKDAQADKDLKEPGSVLSSILTVLGKAIDLVCGFKDKILSFITGESRRYIRLFLQGKIKRKFKWGFDKLWNDLKSTANAVGNAIVSGASKIKDEVVDGVKWAGKKAEEAITYLQEKIKTVFKPLYDQFEKIKAKFINFLQKNPLVNQLIEFAKCFMDIKTVKAIKQLYSTVSAMVVLIPKLVAPAGWVEFVVNLICGWEKLKEAIGYLSKALTEEKQPEKYNLFGKFTAKIFEAIAQ